MPARDAFRWQLADAPSQQGELFAEEEVVERHVGIGEYAGLEFLHVRARSILNRVPASSQVPFSWTINPYRGCSHACTYCFARPTHEYLGLNLAQDFDRRIVVKVNAVERARAELASPRWGRDHVAMGTNTDPYQRAEGKYHLTQGIIPALADSGTPFSILTKSTLILRDLDLLVAAARQVPVRVNFSIGTLDEDVWRASEPGTPHPRRRVEAVRRINEAGLPCGVLVAPVIPGLSDSEDHLAEVVEACVEAGAVTVSSILLHLRGPLRDHFLAWLRSTRPDLADVYDAKYRRAYLPKAEQEAHARTIRSLVDSARRRHRTRTDAVLPTATRLTGATRRRSAAPNEAASSQLSFDIS